MGPEPFIFRISMEFSKFSDFLIRFESCQVPGSCQSKTVTILRELFLCESFDALNDLNQSYSLRAVDSLDLEGLVLYI